MSVQLRGRSFCDDVGREANLEGLGLLGDGRTVVVQLLVFGRNALRTVNVLLEILDSLAPAHLRVYAAMGNAEAATRSLHFEL